jgi:hypothetical protein
LQLERPCRVARGCAAGLGAGAARLGRTQYTIVIFTEVHDPTDMELMVNRILPKIVINGPTLESF